MCFSEFWLQMNPSREELGEKAAQSLEPHLLAVLTAVLGKEQKEERERFSESLRRTKLYKGPYPLEQAAFWLACGSFEYWKDLMDHFASLKRMWRGQDDPLQACDN